MCTDLADLCVLSLSLDLSGGRFQDLMLRRVELEAMTEDSFDA